MTGGGSVEGVRVLMWEAKGDADGLIAWWRTEATASLPEGTSVELYRSMDRVVALVRNARAGLRLPEPPADLVARPPHAWPFETVDVQDREM